MQKKTKVVEQEKEEKTLTPTELQTLQNQVNQLQQQNLILQDMEQLKNENYFRQQILLQLERIVQANERQAKALEESLENSDDEDNNEEED